MHKSGRRCGGFNQLARCYTRRDLKKLQRNASDDDDQLRMRTLLVSNGQKLDCFVRNRVRLMLLVLLLDRVARIISDTNHVRQPLPFLHPDDKISDWPTALTRALKLNYRVTVDV